MARRRPLQPPRAAVLAVALVPLASGLLPAQPPAPFAGEERVVAIDLMVAVDGDDGRKLPSDLRPRDFEIRHDGEARPVVALEVPDAEGAEPWSSVIWLDLVLTARPAVRWAASVLGEQAEALVALGSVEVVVADPHPRVLLEATRDAALVMSTLARFALEPMNAEDAVVAVRDDALESAGEVPAAELVRAAMTAEEALIRRQQDDLLGWLAERPGGGARRALFLVSGGFDLDPQAFYATHLGSEATAAAGAPAFAAIAEGTARLLAAYGWITLPVLAPLAPSSEGVSLGKLFIPEDQEPPPPDPAAIQDVDPVDLGPKLRDPPLGPRAIIRHNRDAKKARAYVDLAATHHRYGDLKSAAEALQKALVHFDGAAETAAEQTAVWVELALTFDRLGRRGAARYAMARAVELDPSQAAGRGGLLARLLAPQESLERLAAVTTGSLLHSPEELTGALAALAGRIRLTYQVSGPPAAELAPVEVRFRGGKRRLLAPAWARNGVPEALAAVRLRRLLAGELDDGELRVEARFAPA
ncbi:MAG: hypothetical protein D6696_14720, partial [Acidobacteria bacterium]